MATKIRLARHGRKNLPSYSIVIASSNSPRDGKFIEEIGFYNPTLDSDNPKKLNLKADRVNFWLSKGAIPTNTMLNIFVKNKEISLPAKLLKSHQTKKRKTSGIKVKQNQQD